MERQQSNRLFRVCPPARQHQARHADQGTARATELERFPRYEALRAAGWVALAVTRQGSHGPGRACINASGSSTDSFATPEESPRLSEHVPWTGCGASMCSTCFPRPGLPADASLPSPGSSGASSPASAVLSKRYDFLPPIPPRFVAFAWRYPSVHSFCSLPGGRVRRRGLELVTR